MMVQRSSPHSVISFYCKSCRLDQDLEASNGANFLCSWFEAHCRTCRKKLLRYINDKTDPYFEESLKLREQRARLAKDLIQYGEAGFKTVYRKQWEAFEVQKENWEKAQEQKKKEKDEFLKKNRLNNLGLAKKILEIEERLEYGRRK